MTHLEEHQLPSIKELGLDLLSTNGFQKTWTILKPFLFFISYFVSAYYNLWVLAILSVLCILFTTYVSTTHDLIHKNLGLSHKVNSFFLIFIEMLVLRSGTTFKLCHLNHHKLFPSKEDIEGEAVYMPLYKVILEGPIYQSKLFFWAYKHSKKNEKRHLLFEEFTMICFIALSIILFPKTPILLYYVLLVKIGSWAYPVFTVYLTHTIEGKSPLFQTRAFRGPIISALFVNHNYHLEHHLYPMVPHQNWSKLAKRLDPYFKRFGVKPISF